MPVNFDRTEEFATDRFRVSFSDQQNGEANGEKLKIQNRSTAAAFLSKNLNNNRNDRGNRDFFLITVRICLG